MDQRIAKIGLALQAIGAELAALAAVDDVPIDSNDDPRQPIPPEPRTPNPEPSTECDVYALAADAATEQADGGEPIPPGCTMQRSLIREWLSQTVQALTGRSGREKTLRLAELLLRHVDDGTLDLAEIEQLATAQGFIDPAMGVPPGVPKPLTVEEKAREMDRLTYMERRRADAAQGHVVASQGGNAVAIWGVSRSLSHELRRAQQGG